MQRHILIRIDDIVNILKTYLGEDDLPASAQPIDFVVNPTQKNMIGLKLVDKSWNGDMGTQLLDIQMKRYFGVGS
jgi:hypothetical protein